MEVLPLESWKGFPIGKSVFLFVFLVLCFGSSALRIAVWNTTNEYVLTGVKSYPSSVTEITTLPKIWNMLFPLVTSMAEHLFYMQTLGLESRRGFLAIHHCFWWRQTSQHDQHIFVCFRSGAINACGLWNVICFSFSKKSRWLA